MHRAITILAACVLLASTSGAAGPDKAIIPDSAAWVVHVDVEALTRAALPKRMMGLITAVDSPVPAEKAIKAQKIWQKLGDVQSLTLYGPSHVEAEAVAVAKLKYETAEVKKLLKIGPGPATHQVAGHDVYTFEAKGPRGRGGGQRFLCFYDESTLIATGSLERLKEAADLLAGEGEKLAPDSELAQLLTPRDGSVVIMAARNVDELAKGGRNGSARKAWFAQKTETLWMEIGEADDEVFLAAGATMKAEEDAVSLQKTAQGLLAMATLAHGEDEMITQVLQSVRIERQDSSVTMSMQCPVRDMLDRVEAKMADRAAAHGAEEVSAEE